jgi:hypothetical protein
VLKKQALTLLFKSAAFLVVLGSSFCFMSTAIAEDKNTDEKVDEKISEKSVCSRLKGESDAWYDVTYTYISTQFCRPAVWFDSFFSTERYDEEVRAGSRVRWRHDYVNTEGQGFDYVTTLTARFKLPKAKKRLNLIFEGEQEETVEGIVPSNREEAKADLGLLYELRKSKRANLSLRIKLSPSVTVRYRYAYPITRTFLTRFTEELFRRDSAYGHSTRIDFEKTLSKDFVLRQSNAGTRAENIDGTNWEETLVLFQHLSDVSALSYESSAVGVTEPDNYVTNSRLGVRYRRNFFRKWLFYELVPAVNFPRPLLTDERKQVWEFMFRLEINFINL